MNHILVPTLPVLNNSLKLDKETVVSMLKRMVLIFRCNSHRLRAARKALTFRLLRLL